MAPRTEALAYRIWAYATPLGWDCSVKEIAEALGDVSWETVRTVMQHKKWLSRVRHDAIEWGNSQAGGPTKFVDLSQEPAAAEIVQRLRREAGL